MSASSESLLFQFHAATGIRKEVGSEVMRAFLYALAYWWPTVAIGICCTCLVITVILIGGAS